MTAFDESYYAQVTEAVEQIESRTAAELVVVIEPHSGSYRDVSYLAGLLLALLALGFILLNPWTVHPPQLVPLEVLLFFVLGAGLTLRRPLLQRLLTSARRRREQVALAAAAQFFDQGVRRTRARTGVLVYLSLMERELRVLADSGVIQAVDQQAWQAALAGISAEVRNRPAPALRDGLQTLGDLLAAALPATEDNPNELPNRPCGGGSPA